MDLLTLINKAVTAPCCVHLAWKVISWVSTRACVILPAVAAGIGHSGRQDTGLEPQPPPQLMTELSSEPCTEGWEPGLLSQM